MRLHPQPENHSISPGLLVRPASGFSSIVPSQETAPEKWAALQSPAYAEVGRRVFRQLIEAFIFEDIGKIETRPATTRRATNEEVEYTLLPLYG